MVDESVGLPCELPRDAVRANRAGARDGLAEVRVDGRRAHTANPPQLVGRDDIEALDEVVGDAERQQRDEEDGRRVRDGDGGREQLRRAAEQLHERHPNLRV